MECYYDTLFECACEGVKELRNIPCAYQYDALFFSMSRPGVIATRFTYVDKSLFKKMQWIAKCGSYQGGYLHRFISLKSPITRYILEVRNKYEYYERSPGFWDYRTRPTVPSCYYLGTYPIYWNIDNKGVAYPDNLGTANSYPIGTKAGIPKKVKGMGLIQFLKESFEKGTEPMEFIPDVDRNDMKDVVNEFGLENVLNYLKPGRITKKMTLDEESALRELNGKIDQTLSHITFRYDRDLLFDYFLQDDWFSKRDKAFKACLAAQYPKKPREPVITVPTLQAPAEFPGKPMEELLKPSPEMTPLPGPPLGKRILKLTFYFGIKPDVPYNALALETIFLER